MSVKAFLSEYWRVILLVVFVTAAVAALFVPGGIIADDSLAGQADDAENETVDESLTNLQYGLGLDGGTRISAPVVGMTAENLEIDPEREAEVEQTLYEELELETGDALVRFDGESGLSTAEVFDDDVTEEEFAAALQEAGVDADEGDVRSGVTQDTRDEIIQTIEMKINEAGLSGGSVSQSSTVGGEYFIVVEVPDRTPSELRSLLSERGIVEVVAHHPDGEGGQANETVLEEDDFDTIDAATYNERTGHHVPVSIASNSAPEYQQRMIDLGFVDNPGQCDYENPEMEGQNYCLLTVVDGEVVDAHSMGADLAQTMGSGQWADDPTFIMGAPSQQEAQSLSINLQAGSLRAPLDFDRDQTFSLQPALADQFKTYSLFIGVLSVLTVSGMVYLRYTDVRVAAPMVVTALAEVVILLGFAALIRMPLDLSHVAGFIAVVGTGVDDLIIIADEVMSEGDVNSQRVFESRFRKAFWVIGAAAATTILAMSPLAVLSLGDLRGFAIITILGVLVGVLITRPAYGDILRLLMTDK
ncbi:preprotein translocase subunit SecD [Natrononativus amylolyticus]|uniref:preprotein translocase subunit SecD n=1 Tax=Natrononativus amylolyticus TaxID=2963434 RepID=UPI0020CE6C31|nr:preprotein translocase subunit SecD [Natrononativus amylolyticus]